MGQDLREHVVLSKEGRIVIPSAIREAAGLKPGSRVIVTVGADGVVEIRSVETSRARAWKLARKHRLHEKPLVEDLLEQRKAERSRG